MTRRSCWYGLTIIVAAIMPAQAQSTAPAIPVPETIRAEGVPPIPASVRQALNRYQNIRSATFQDWASDGSGMYVITRFADVPQVHFVAAAGGARTQLTFLDERVLGVSARPRHDQFLYVADEGGTENYQLFLQDRKGGEARRITDGKSRNMAPKWSPSGELLAWSSNARNGRDMDLYVGSPFDSRFARRIKEVSGQWTVSDWSPDETRVVAVEYISINESHLHIIDVATGKTETITPRQSDPKAERIFAGGARWPKDGNAIYYITDQENEFRRLARYDMVAESVKILTESIRWDIEEFEVTDDGAYAMLAANENGGVRLHSLSLRTGELSPPETAKVTDGILTGLKFCPGTSRIAFSLSTSRAADVYTADAYRSDAGSPVASTLHSPVTVVPLDASSGTGSTPASRWTFSETGGLDPNDFAEARRIEYPTFDRRKIPAFLYRPSARKFPGPRPVLIDIHGGPEGQFRPGFIGRLNYLVDELGLVLIFPNVRGSSGYGKTYLKLDNGKLRADAVKDIGALLDWIATQKDLDKSRVGVTGGSYGGFMSLAVQANYNDRIKAGIDIVGISNFVSFLKNTQGYRRDLRRAEYGDERDPEMRSYLERISPLTNADKIRTPILIVQGQNDPRVPISESQQMVAALRKNKVPVWYVVGTNEGHGFAKKANQDYLQAVEVEFLRRYLLEESR